jgi:hypothetical protein
VPVWTSGLESGSVGALRWLRKRKKIEIQPRSCLSFGRAHQSDWLRNRSNAGPDYFTACQVLKKSCEGRVEDGVRVELWGKSSR